MKLQLNVPYEVVPVEQCPLLINALDNIGAIIHVWKAYLYLYGYGLIITAAAVSEKVSHSFGADA